MQHVVAIDSGSVNRMTDEEERALWRDLPPSCRANGATGRFRRDRPEGAKPLESAAKAVPRNAV